MNLFALLAWIIRASFGWAEMLWLEYWLGRVCSPRTNQQTIRVACIDDYSSKISKIGIDRFHFLILYLLRAKRAFFWISLNVYKQLKMRTISRQMWTNSWQIKHTVVQSKQVNTQLTSVNKQLIIRTNSRQM